MSTAQLFTEVHETNLHSRLRSPDASFLLACWEMARAGRDIPEEADFLRQPIGSARPNLMILRLQPDGDLRYEHYGETIAKHAGFDMTGRCVSAFQGELRHFYMCLYGRVIAERRPLASLHRIGAYKERPLWERLLVPVAKNGTVTALHVVNTVRELDHDLSVLSVKSRNNGLIALQFERDAAGDVSDAVVAGANRHALAMTGRRLDEVLGRSMVACFPGVVSTGLWGRYLAVAASRTEESFSLVYDRDGVSGIFEVTIAPFHDGVTIEFAPQSAPVN